MFTKWISLVIALASVAVITSIVAAEVRDSERAYFNPVLAPGSLGRPLGERVSADHTPVHRVPLSRPGGAGLKQPTRRERSEKRLSLGVLRDLCG
jgi:hypothetical protein